MWPTLGTAQHHLREFLLRTTVILTRGAQGPRGRGAEGPRGRGAEGRFFQNIFFEINYFFGFLGFVKKSPS